MTSFWLHALSQVHDPAVRLVCFPHAGGSATVFRRWPSELPADVELLGVQYPGRGSRLKEPLVSSVAAMATLIREELSQRPVMPTMFFGHSLGGAIAFEVAHQFAVDGLMPKHLFVSSRLPPHLPLTQTPVSHLPDADFLREIGRRYAAVPNELLQYPDVLALLLPALRSDLMAIEQYQGSPVKVVACPITAFGGLDDDTTTRRELEAWHKLTSASFRVKMFPGGHFYLETQRGALLAEISGTLVCNYR